MLQRVQTLYLLGVAILHALTLFLPIASLVTSSEELIFETIGIYSSAKEIVYSTWGLFIISSAISLISMVTIGLFKKRMVQIRLSIFNACLMIGFYGVFAFFTWVTTGKFTADLAIRIPLSFPLIGFILNWLAIRAIGADEALVRSLNRIR